MTDITLINLREELDRQFPELRDAVTEQIDYYDEPEPIWFAVLSMTFYTFMMSSLARSDQPNLVRVFAFVELLSRSKDDYIEALATDMVEEILGNGTAHHRAAAEAVMGPATRKLYERTRPWFRTPKN